MKIYFQRTCIIWNIFENIFSNISKIYFENIFSNRCEKITFYGFFFCFLKIDSSSFTKLYCNERALIFFSRIISQWQMIWNFISTSGISEFQVYSINQGSRLVQEKYEHMPDKDMAGKTAKGWRGSKKFGRSSSVTLCGWEGRLRTVVTLSRAAGHALFLRWVLTTLLMPLYLISRWMTAPHISHRITASDIQSK